MSKPYERILRAQGKAWFEEVVIGKIGGHSLEVSPTETIQRIGSGQWKDFTEGYKAYLFQDSDTELPSSIRDYLNLNRIPYMTQVNPIEGFADTDVIILNNPKNAIRWAYRADSEDNVLLVTNQCNSNCVMCPDSEALRKSSLISPIRFLTEWISLLPKNIRHLCISGGEPTLLKEDLFLLLQSCKESLPDCNFLMLTNGRMFVYPDYVKQYMDNRPPSLVLGIPLHHFLPQIHDSITQVTGSLHQTISGLRKLHDHGEFIEIRVVVQQRNAGDLAGIARYIATHFPNVLKVNFMALEMLGNALKNKDHVWVRFQEVRESLIKACYLLIQEGIHVQLYNFPLCYLPESLWSLAVRSITDHKICYATECIGCEARELCGGFFPTTLQICNHEVFPVRG